MTRILRFSVPAAVILCAGSVFAETGPGGPKGWRPATREGAALYRTAKQQRRPVSTTAARGLFLEAARTLKRRDNIDGAYHAVALIQDATHLSGALSPKKRRVVERLGRRAAHALLRHAASSYPGDTLHTARTALGLRGLTRADRRRANELAGTALAQVLDQFVQHTEARNPRRIAAFRDDRVRDADGIRELAGLKLELDGSLAARVGRAKARALALVDSPAFARFVAEGHVRDPSPFKSAKPPRTVAELRQVLALPIRHIDDVRGLERLLARSSVKVTSGSDLQPALLRVARRAAEEVSSEVRFRAHYVEGRGDTSHFLKSAVADRYLATIKRLDGRLARLGAGVEARRALGRAARQLTALGMLLDPGLSSSRLHQRQIDKDLPR